MYASTINLRVHPGAIARLSIADELFSSGKAAARCDSLSATLAPTPTEKLSEQHAFGLDRCISVELRSIRIHRCSKGGTPDVPEASHGARNSWFAAGLAVVANPTSLFSQAASSAQVCC